MATDSPQIFLQDPIFTRFILPFLLVFFVVFAILEKTKLLGKENTKQINALVSFVIGLIFITVLSPTLVVQNLVLFLSVALVIVFVVLLIWSFVSGEDGFKLGEHKTFRTILLVTVLLAVGLGILWAFGVNLIGGQGSLINTLFGQVWSGPFWTNVIFGVLIAIALALVLGGARAAKKD